MRIVNSPRISPPGSDYRHAETVLMLPFYNSSRKSFAVNGAVRAVREVGVVALHRRRNLQEAE
jgi:hypothetical protein